MIYSNGVSFLAGEGRPLNIPIRISFASPRPLSAPAPSLSFAEAMGVFKSVAMHTNREAVH